MARTSASASWPARQRGRGGHDLGDRGRLAGLVEGGSPAGGGAGAGIVTAARTSPVARSMRTMLPRFGAERLPGAVALRAKSVARRTPRSPWPSRRRGQGRGSQSAAPPASGWNVPPASRNPARTPRRSVTVTVAPAACASSTRATRWPRPGAAPRPGDSRGSPRAAIVALLDEHGRLVDGAAVRVPAARAKRARRRVSSNAPRRSAASMSVRGR